MRAIVLATVLLAPTAAAQSTALNRCVAADGTAVFTDRPCDAMDARPAPTAPPDPDTLPDRVATVRECPRRPADLVAAIEVAIAAADGNRLAELYDWRGRSSASARALMPRLEALAAARIVEVRAGHSAESSADAELAAEAAEAPPDRLRIVHAPMAGGARETTEFRLVRAAGCWWIAD
jgi:hypothetical protein